MHYYYHKTNRILLKLKTPIEDSNYVEMTEEEYLDAQNAISSESTSKGSNIEIKLQIMELKSQLQQTDYQAIKYAEGWLTEKEYAPIKAQRQSLRDEINRLEARL